MAEKPRRLVYSKTGQLLYSDSTAVKLFTLPAGAIPLRVTAFNDATMTSGTLTLGSAADDDLFVSALDVASAAPHAATLLSWDQLTVPTDIYGSIAGASAGGPLHVVMEYTYTKTTRVV
jgi:hypothetical protein